VWRGTDEVVGRTVAVSVVVPRLLNEPGFQERFRGEARTMANLSRPGVVDVYDYRSDGTLAFLVVEYVEGEALSAVLQRVGRLPPARTMPLVAQAADALQAAHDKGIVHRDIKPGNLMVRPDGRLVLTDFGVARSALVGQITATGAVLGTAGYLSPEQADGRPATAASDIYALGVVAYQCLAGRRPFEGDNPIEVAMRHLREEPPPLPPDIPPPVRAVVSRALAKDPAQRWPSAAEFAAAARRAAGASAAASAGAGGVTAPATAAAAAAAAGGTPRAGGADRAGGAALPRPASPRGRAPPARHAAGAGSAGGTDTTLPPVGGRRRRDGAGGGGGAVVRRTGGIRGPAARARRQPRRPVPIQLNRIRPGDRRIDDDMTASERLLGGRYEVGELLGYGGMAEVHRGRDLRLGRDVAIKMLRTDLARDNTFQMRFRREAQNAATLNHPGIAAIYDTGGARAATGEPLPYLVMEDVNGRTLKDVLAVEGRLRPRRALEITADICAALEFSHRHGIIHRDVKPGNVMVTPNGQVKVMDFGIARDLASGATTMTQTSAVIGTAQYLSPEQARGEAVDARSDVYATGCVLFELVCGHPPFV